MRRGLDRRHQRRTGGFVDDGGDDPSMDTPEWVRHVGRRCPGHLCLPVLRREELPSTRTLGIRRWHGCRSLLVWSDVTARILPVRRSRSPFGPLPEVRVSFAGRWPDRVGWPHAPSARAKALRRRAVTAPSRSILSSHCRSRVDVPRAHARVRCCRRRALDVSDAETRVHERRTLSFGHMNSDSRMSCDFTALSKVKRGLFRRICSRVYLLQQQLQQVERGPHDRSWRTCRQCYCVCSGGHS